MTSKVTTPEATIIKSKVTIITAIQQKAEFVIHLLITQFRQIIFGNPPVRLSRDNTRTSQT